MQEPIITLPDSVRDSIMWMTVEAWDQMTDREEIIARQIELVADDYEKTVMPDRNWHMYD